MTPDQIIELIEALDLNEHDHIIDAVLLARVKDFDSGSVGICMSPTVDVDWVGQLGILRAAELITTRGIRKGEVDD